MVNRSQTSTVRKRVGMDQEKQAITPMDPEHRHNDAPSQKTAIPRWRRGREKSTIALVCTWIVDRQLSLAATLLSILFFVHFTFPEARHHTRKFFQISYYNPESGNYALGWDDICFVFYWIIFFFGARCATMDYVLSPIAALAGINKKKAKIRFAEQLWILLYYNLFAGTGLYLYYNSDYWLDLRALWRGWPTREMDGLAKWYYLVQFAFWLQQIAVVNIEERRKDHWQMFSHHIITCALIFTSYGYHQTKVGNVILVLMDIGDITFAFAKILKYLGFQTACDLAFGVFMVSWFVLRHACYMTVWWSIYKHIPEEIQYGCYRGSDGNLTGPTPAPKGITHLVRPFLDPEGLICWNAGINWTFLGMLGALQCVLLVWFSMIIKVAYKVLSGAPADDSRSDDEDDEEEEISIKDEVINTVPTTAEKIPLLEKEVLSTDQDFSLPSTSTARSAPTSTSASPVRKSPRKKGDGHSSSVNLLGGSDRKELLGRIGCDKPAD